MSGYNFDFGYLSIFQAVTLSIAQLLPEHWTGNNLPALIVLLLSQTEISFVHNINANMFIISFLNLKVFFLMHSILTYYEHFGRYNVADVTFLNTLRQ